MTDLLAALRRRVGAEADAQLLQDLLRDAEIYIRFYTGREEMPAALEPVQVQLAAVNYRRFGAEGEKSHEEGGVRIAFDTELATVKEQLRPWRMGRVGLAGEADAE